jgi:hypothetical protein
MDRKDPESSRFTYVTSFDDSRLFDIAEPGDRLEIHEERGEVPTGRVLTARVLDMKKIRVG